MRKSIMMALVMTLFFSRDELLAYKMLERGDRVMLKSGKVSQIASTTYCLGIAELDLLLKERDRAALLQQQLDLTNRLVEIEKRERELADQQAEKWRQACEHAYGQMDKMVKVVVEQTREQAKGKRGQALVNQLRDLGLLWIGSRAGR